MSKKLFKIPTRRAFLTGSAAVLATPLLAQTNDLPGFAERDQTKSVRRNISSFRTLDWRTYFENTQKGAILVDIDSRAVHFLQLRMLRLLRCNVMENFPGDISWRANRGSIGWLLGEKLHQSRTFPNRCKHNC